ncbi:MAG TPA: biotin/lipoyl-binding protein, partial [Anaerolineales bacterium]
MAEMRRWLSAVLLGWIIFLGACSPDPGSQQTPQIQTQDSVSAPTGRAIGVRGVLEPARWVELSFGREGRVLEVLVEPGEMVEADQPLAKLDDRQARQAVARAEANLTLAQAELANLVAEPSAEELAVAEAQLAVVEAQLEDALRLSSIVAGAQAEVLLQEARMADFLAGADEFERALAEARLAQAELLYDQALADLDMLVLKAPFSGRIAQVSV